MTASTTFVVFMVYTSLNPEYWTETSDLKDRVTIIPVEVNGAITVSPQYSSLVSCPGLLVYLIC